MDVNVFLNTLEVCEATFDELEQLIPPPKMVSEDDDFHFRYEQKTPKVLVIQKLSRVYTGLKSCLVLLEKGLYQEVGVIFRLLDEFREDIEFMCISIRSGEITELDQRFVNEFFQPEFDNQNPFLATQKRDRVSRRQIQFAIASITENPVNPSDSQELARTISNVNSGYVHAASEHILDMYGGNPPGYYLNGMLGTLRQEEWENLAWNYFYRALLTFMCAAQAFGCAERVQSLYEYRDGFEQAWGNVDWECPEKLIKDLKKKPT